MFICLNFNTMKLPVDKISCILEGLFVHKITPFYFLEDLLTCWNWPLNCRSNNTALRVESQIENIHIVATIDGAHYRNPILVMVGNSVPMPLHYSIHGPRRQTVEQ